MEAAAETGGSPPRLALKPALRLFRESVRLKERTSAGRRQASGRGQCAEAAQSMSLSAETGGVPASVKEFGRVLGRRCVIVHFTI